MIKLFQYCSKTWFIWLHLPWY